MQATTETLSVQGLTCGDYVECFTTSTEEATYEILSALGRKKNFSFQQKVELRGELVLSDGLLIPFPKDVGDELFWVYTNIPAVFLHEAWILAQKPETDSLEVVGKVCNECCSFSNFNLQIPHRYVREQLFLRLYFHGSSWLKSPRKNIVALEYILFPKWRRERVSKAQLKPWNRGELTLHPAGVGELSIHP